MLHAYTVLGDSPALVQAAKTGGHKLVEISLVQTNEVRCLGLGTSLGGNY